MNRGAVPFERTLIFIQFENHAVGNGNYCTGNDIMMAGTACQINYRLTGFGDEILSEKTAPFFFDKLKSRGLDGVDQSQSRQKRHRSLPP